MAEATALRERIELLLPDQSPPVVAGFRDRGRWSVYFGPDPAYHFDAEGALRRAFVGGDLYRSHAHTLARLTRSRTGTAVYLVRNDLAPTELQRFLAQMGEDLDRLHSALEKGAARIVQQIPAGGDLRQRLLQVIAGAQSGQLSAAIKKRRPRR